jgi:DNA-binding transcriptional ArsR family regulator
MNTKTQIVMNPVRLRIIAALQGRRMTRMELARVLNDVPQATLYRQVNTLAAGGILEVAEQHMVRGIVESTYRMKPGAAHLDRSEFAALPPDEHIKLFSVFAGVQTVEAKRYFEQFHYDTSRDGMTYFRAALLLSDKEARSLRLDLLALVKRYGSKPSARRRMRFVSIASIPEAREASCK